MTIILLIVVNNYVHYNHPIKWRAHEKERVLFYSVFTGYGYLTQQMTTDVSTE